MLDDFMGGLGGGGSSSKQLSSATATTSIADVFSNGGQSDASQLNPVLLAGLVVVAIVIIAAFAFRK